jgi:hypothetical protein
MLYKAPNSFEDIGSDERSSTSRAQADTEANGSYPGFSAWYVHKHTHHSNSILLRVELVGFTTLCLIPVFGPSVG